MYIYSENKHLDIKKDGKVNKFGHCGDKTSQWCYLSFFLQTNMGVKTQSCVVPVPYPGAFRYHIQSSSNHFTH